MFLRAEQAKPSKVRRTLNRPGLDESGGALVKPARPAVVDNVPVEEGRRRKRNMMRGVAANQLTVGRGN